MADETKIIQVNQGTGAQWNSAVRPLKNGEFGFNTDTKELKIGDGASSFAALPAFLTEADVSVSGDALRAIADSVIGIGAIRALPFLPPGHVLANGGTLAQADTAYPKLWAWLSDAGAAGGQQFAVSLAAWNAEWNDDSVWRGNVGACGKYVLDAVQKTIKLPDLTGLAVEFSGFDGLGVMGTHGDMIRDIKTASGSATNIPWGNYGISQLPLPPFVERDVWSFNSFSVYANAAAKITSMGIDVSLVHPVGNAVKPRALGLLPCIYAG